MSDDNIIPFRKRPIFEDVTHEMPELVIWNWACEMREQGRMPRDVLIAFAMHFKDFLNDPES
jgi:hypothetical protein